MRKGLDIGTVRQIATIRDLQQAAATAQTVRAAAALREREAACDESEKQCLSVEQGWRGALAGGVGAMETLPLWSAALLRADATVRAAGRDADAARAELAASKSRLHAADAHSDLARDMVRDAIAARLARREETAAQQAADLHLQRRGAA